MSGNETTAKALGYAGLIPFVVFSIGAWVRLPYVDNAIPVLVAYAAVILAFMGAVHWGIALSSAKSGRSPYYIASVVPALVAWLALLMPESYAIPVLLTAFIVLLAYDSAVTKPQQFPEWYVPLRIKLTLVVALCLASTLPLSYPVTSAQV